MKTIKDLLDSFENIEKALAGAILTYDEVSKHREELPKMPELDNEVFQNSYPFELPLTAVHRNVNEWVEAVKVELKNRKLI